MRRSRGSSPPWLVFASLSTTRARALLQRHVAVTASTCLISQRSSSSSPSRSHSSSASSSVSTSPTTTGVGQPALGVYVHWPYCARICPYCDFNRYVAEKGAIDHQRMGRAYQHELTFFHDFLERQGTAQSLLIDGRTQRRVRSVFFGGGTPSLAHPQVMEEVLEFINTTFGFEDDAEITMEANPTSVEVDKLRDFRRAGINRLSIGVQSLNSADLKYLGRAHSPEEALRAIELAKSIFPRMSFDLIYARHRNQRVEEWRQELQKALALADGHISLYTLTLEPGTAFYRRAFHPPTPSDALPYPDEERVADLYDTTVSTAAEAGYNQYEVSNYARPGQESRHNLIYWKSEDWIGIGPGAHGRLTTLDNQRHAFTQIKLPNKWMEAVEEKGHGTHEHKIVSLMERTEELLLNGMRIQDGISPQNFIGHTGRSFEEVLDMAKVKQLQEEGFVLYDPITGLRPTSRGISLVDALLPMILPDAKNFAA